MLLCPWNSPDKNTGMGSHSFLQRIFPTQGSNLVLLHCRQILYHLSYQGSPIKSHILMLFDWPEWDWGRRKSLSCCDGSFWISCVWRLGAACGRSRHLSSCTWTILSLQRPAVCFGDPLQYSCLENPMDGGAWQAVVHGVAEGWTWLSDFTFTFHFHALEKKMATHSSVLAWRTPGMGEPGGLLSMASHRVGHDWSNLGAAVAAVC